MNQVTNQQIVAVMNPEVISNDRQLHGEKVSTVPKYEDWRYEPTTLGAQVQVAANNFMISKANVVGEIYQHRIDIAVIFKPRGDEPRSANKPIEDKRDVRIRVAVMNAFRNAHPEWNDVGITFDGQNDIFSTRCLVSKTHPSYVAERESIEEEVSLAGRQFFVSLKDLSIRLDLQQKDFNNLPLDILRALGSVVFHFARKQVSDTNVTWVVDNSNAFRSDSNDLPSPIPQFMLGYIFKKGYKASLKSCVGGLALMVDMAVTCFLKGGELVKLMALVLGYRDVQEMQRAKGNGLNSEDIRVLHTHFKSAQVSWQRNNQPIFKKIFDFGPSAETPYTFGQEDGRPGFTSVAQYFREKYPDQPLKFPWLPCVDVGRKNKTVLIPCELLTVLAGQVRHGRVNKDPNMLAALIKESAVKPDERFRHVAGSGDGKDFISCVKNDETAKLFGISSVSPEPLSVRATILPQAKLMYGNGEFDPKLTGAWNMANKTFARAAPAATFLIMVCDRLLDARAVGALEAEFENAASRLGMKFRPLRAFDDRRDVSRDNANTEEIVNQAKNAGADILIVILSDRNHKDDYSYTKLVADKLGLPTQCLKSKNVFQKKPNQYETSVLLKINTKLGGVNHTLINRIDPGRKMTGDKYNPNNSSEVFQDPPASLSWVFNKPTMFMGIDVSHPEGHGDAPSISAVVGSMDRYGMQYACKIYIQDRDRSEIVDKVHQATLDLMNTFKARNNGVLPEQIIVYRDGVSEGQFQEMLESELPNIISGASEAHDFQENRVKICAIVCQKSHNNRFVYKNGSEYINLCPGTCVDSREGQVVSCAHNEFFLTSHSAIQGTSKATKYVVAYDTIGLKMNEIELLTYWSTYLYCRCNKSIGIATPAKYAHWAAKRGNFLQQNGAANSDFEQITNAFNTGDKRSTFFFI